MLFVAIKRLGYLMFLRNCYGKIVFDLHKIIYSSKFDTILDTTNYTTDYTITEKNSTNSTNLTHYTIIRKHLHRNQLDDVIYRKSIRR
jgi:hypothetical protein